MNGLCLWWVRMTLRPDWSLFTDRSCNRKAPKRPRFCRHVRNRSGRKCNRRARKDEINRLCFWRVRMTLRHDRSLLAGRSCNWKARKRPHFCTHVCNRSERKCNRRARKDEINSRCLWCVRMTLRPTGLCSPAGVVTGKSENAPVFAHMSAIA